MSEEYLQERQRHSRKNVAKLNLEQATNYLNHFEARGDWQDLVDSINNIIHAMKALLLLTESKCNCKKGD